MNKIRKILFYIARVIIIITIIILSKSIFLCGYYNIFTWEQLIQNIFSLSSGLMGIGYFTGNFVGNLLNKTSYLNLSLRDIINLDFFKSKLILGDQEFSSNIKVLEPNKLKTTNNADITEESSGSSSKIHKDTFDLFSKLDKLLTNRNEILTDIEKKLQEMKNSSSTLSAVEDSNLKKYTKAELNKCIEDLVNMRNAHGEAADLMMKSHEIYFSKNRNDKNVLLDLINAAINEMNSNLDKYEATKKTYSSDNPNYLKIVMDLENNIDKKNRNISLKLENKIFGLMKDKFNTDPSLKSIREVYDKEIRIKWINERESFIISQNRLKRELAEMLNNKRNII